MQSSAVHILARVYMRRTLYTYLKTAHGKFLGRVVILI